MGVRRFLFEREKGWVEQLGALMGVLVWVFLLILANFPDAKDFFFGSNIGSDKIVPFMLALVFSVLASGVAYIISAEISVVSKGDAMPFAPTIATYRDVLQIIEQRDGIEERMQEAKGETSRKLARCFWGSYMITVMAGLVAVSLLYLGGDSPGYGFVVLVVATLLVPFAVPLFVDMRARRQKVLSQYSFFRKIN
ncbi:MAG: hypothetical protein K9K75_06585 [Deltaproteobacteria bacterium]|nr:hypothetical protein [Deltaproteobacteria bacterium]